MIPDRIWLTDAQFAKIAPHRPTDTRGKARVDDRRVISGIVHVLKSGGRWIDAPPEYGPRKTLYNRYISGGRSRPAEPCPTAQGESKVDELLLAIPLPQPQRHRAHVLPAERLHAHRHTLWSERSRLPRRCLHRRDSQLDPSLSLAARVGVFFTCIAAGLAFGDLCLSGMKKFFSSRCRANQQERPICHSCQGCQEVAMNQPLGILGTPDVGFFALLVIGGLAGWIAGMVTQGCVIGY